MCLKHGFVQGVVFFFLKSLSLKMDASPRPYGLPFVGSHNIFTYGWSSEEGCANRNLTDGAALSSIIHSASSFVGKTCSITSHI